MRKWMVWITAIIALVMGAGIVSAYAADTSKGEFGDRVDVELAFSSSPFLVQDGDSAKKYADWDGVTKKKNTGKYVFCHVTDKETGEQLKNNKDYQVSGYYLEEEGDNICRCFGPVGDVRSYTLFFTYKGDASGDQGYVKKDFTVVSRSVKASDIKIQDLENALPKKYTGKIRRFTPESITVGDSSFFNNNKKYWTLVSSKFTNATKVGTATAKYKFKFKNGFKGTVTKTFKYKIIPKDVVFTTCKRTKNTITLRWKKHKTQTTGFRIKVYRLEGEDEEDEEGGEGGTEWKKVKTVYAKSNTATSKKIKGLKKNSWYMFEVQAYKTVKGKKYYSEKAVKQMGTKR